MKDLSSGAAIILLKRWKDSDVLLTLLAGAFLHMPRPRQITIREFSIEPPMLSFEFLSSGDVHQINLTGSTLDATAIESDENDLPTVEILLPDKEFFVLCEV